MSNSEKEDTAASAPDAEFDLDEAVEEAAASQAALPHPPTPGFRCPRIQ